MKTSSKLPSFTPRPKSFWERNFANVFLWIGIPFLIGSVYFWIDSRDSVQKYKTTIGRVIDYEGRSRQSNRTVAPVIEYRPDDGKLRLYYHDVYSRPPAYEIGEEVTVYYDPTNPDNANLGYSWLKILVCGGLGIVFTGFGILFKKFLNF